MVPLLASTSTPLQFFSIQFYVSPTVQLISVVFSLRFRVDLLQLEPYRLLIPFFTVLSNPVASPRSGLESTRTTVYFLAPWQEVLLTTSIFVVSLLDGVYFFWEVKSLEHKLCLKHLQATLVSNPQFTLCWIVPFLFLSVLCVRLLQRRQCPCFFAASKFDLWLSRWLTKVWLCCLSERAFT